MLSLEVVTFCVKTFISSRKTATEGRSKEKKMANKLKFMGMILENNLPSQLCVTDGVDYFHPWSCGPPIYIVASRH